MSTQFEDASVEPQAAVTIDQDIPCRRCSYNLRGLQSTGLCPECGTPTGLSISGDFLRYADPAWVQNLATGANWLLWSIAIVIVAMVLGAIIGNQIFATLLSFAAGCAGLYGAWLLTAPDPSGIGEDPLVTSRKLVRISIAIGLAGQLLTMLEEMVQLSGAAGTALVLLVIVVSLIAVVGEIAKLHYLGRLAARIPEYTLADRARFLMWGYGIGLGVMAVFGGLALLLGSKGGGAGGGGGAAIGLACIVGLAGLAMLVFGVMYLFLLLRMRKALAQQATLAQQVWSQAGERAAT